MSLSKFSGDVENISKLDDYPSDDHSTTAIKTLFDKAGKDIKDYLNGTLTPELDAQLALAGSYDVTNAVALLKTSRRNLLHNYDFRKPVNTRGQSNYTSYGYTADRWLLGVGAVTLGVNGITLTSTGSYDNYFRQYLGHVALIPGDTYTLSVEDSNGTIYSVSGVYSTTTALVEEKPFGALYVGYYLGLPFVQITFRLSNITARRIKLEAGSVSTLANDPPADYAEQLLICQSVSDDGKTYTRGFGSNKNLLHNWDFRRPVNQRGLSTYNTLFGYTIDRWFLSFNGTGAVSISGGGITLTKSSGVNFDFRQYLNFAGLSGKTVTASVEVGGTIYSGTGTFDATFIFNAGPDISVIALVENDKCEFILRLWANTSATITRVKIELGSVSTFANDPPADYAEQLLICQSITDDGSIYTRGYGSNKNLLHNWDFRNPVNQRNITTKTSDDYVIDRWLIYTEGTNAFSFTVNSDSLRIAASSHWLWFLQRIEKLAYGVYTISVKHKNGSIYSKTVTWAGSEVGGEVTPGLGIRLFWSLAPAFLLQVSAGYTFDIESAKLEIGAVSTLANDPPADYGEELRKCQRYFETIKMIKGGIYGTGLDMCIPFRTRKRIGPTLTLKSFAGTVNKISSHNGTGFVDTAFTQEAGTDNARIMATTSSYDSGTHSIYYFDLEASADL
jgi:hypothetical protein